MWCALLLKSMINKPNLYHQVKGAVVNKTSDESLLWFLHSFVCFTCYQQCSQHFQNTCVYILLVSMFIRSMFTRTWFDFLFGLIHATVVTGLNTPIPTRRTKPWCVMKWEECTPLCISACVLLPASQLGEGGGRAFRAVSRYKGLLCYSSSVLNIWWLFWAMSVPNSPALWQTLYNSTLWADWMGTSCWCVSIFQSFPSQAGLLIVS